METGLEGKLVDGVIEEAVGKLSPFRKILGAIKKVLTALIFLKWIWVSFVAWFDNVRRATIIQAMDKFPEDKVWKTILWIKTWRYIYGIIIGLLLAYYFAADDLLIAAFDFVKEFLSNL